MPVTTTSGDLTTVRFAATTDGEGRLVVPVEVASDDVVLAVAVSSSARSPVVERITDPAGFVVLEGADWASSDERLTTAVERTAKSTAIQWPIREEDGELSPGTWQVELVVVDEGLQPQPGESVDVTATTRRDDDLTEGTITVRLVYADGVGDVPEYVAAAEQAVEVARAAFDAAGITLVETWHDSTLDPQLGFSGWSDPTMEALVAQIAEPGDLVAVFAAGYPGSSRGITPTVPVPLDRSGYRYSAVAIDAHVESSRGLDDNARDMVGQTLAHELAHAMGLMHVVEIPDFDTWDALADTDECTSAFPCEDVLADNLVYPYVNCDSSGICGVNVSLTPDQAGVLQRFIGTR